MRRSPLVPVLGLGLLLGLPSAAASVSGQGTWETTLQGRDLDGDPTTAEAWYDSVLDITWLADASYAQTSGYDADGNMDWGTATTWASNLDPYGSHITGWRLPHTNPVNGVSYDYGFAFDGSKDEGYNISAPGSVYEGALGSEMAHMYYDTLGNLAPYDSNGSSQSGGGLTNTGPFSNLQAGGYWSATPTDAGHAFVLYFDYGSQGADATASPHAAWAVHDGDVGTAVASGRLVPIPFWADVLLAGLLASIGISIQKRSLRPRSYVNDPFA